MLIRSVTGVCLLKKSCSIPAISTAVMVRSFLPLLRGFSSRYSKRVAGCLLAAAGTTTAAYAFTVANNKPAEQFAFRFPLMTQCAAKVFPQSSVINPLKEHSLFLTIHLRPGCTAQECLKELGNMQVSFWNKSILIYFHRLICISYCHQFKVV
ncbi:hypothetical protein AHF37_09249 [Paragonimus kellicotti]|nr:hypothetical protein AHF37_09249 [Paragonimus kellicotti]